MRTLFRVGGIYLAISVMALAQSDGNSPQAATQPLLKRDRGSERQPLSSKIYLAFDGGNFDLLESTHQEMMASDARFSDGTAKLDCFYNAMSEPRDSTEEAWQAFFKKIEDWRAAKPDSIVADTIKAQALTEYAWKARGSGEADTVTTEGWKLMGERLAEARQILDRDYEAHQGKDIPPGWYTAMQTVALGQGWKPEEYAKMFDEAVTAYPDYEDLFFYKSYFLQTKWYGKLGDWQAFAEDCGKKYGPEYYTRICWYCLSNYGYEGIFTKGQVSWPEMKEGFEGLEKQWPTSLWNISAFCRFACAAHDKETAKRLFDKMGDQAFTDLWGTNENFNAAKAWANSPSP